MIHGSGNLLEEEMATHSSIPAWEILWTEAPGRLQSMGSQRAGHDLVTKPPPPQLIYNVVLISGIQQSDSVIYLYLYLYLYLSSYVSVGFPGLSF